jgi:hypothetical protein
VLAGNSTTREEKNWLENVISSLLSYREGDDDAGSVEEMIDAAAQRAFRISTGLGLLPGPIGMATILPEVAVLTRLQINLVYRIAKHHGKQHKVNREIVLLIMANATGLAAGEVLLRRAGTTFVVKSVNTKAIRTIARKVGSRIVDMAAGKAVCRWIPLFTAPLFGYFSRSLTRRIGREADRFFLQDLEIEAEGPVS